MPTLPPPPVPQRLREILKDYPQHLQVLQNDLNQVIAKPFQGTPIFEQAIWALEDALGGFIDEARDELQAAEVSGDAEAIAKAEKKDFAVGYARMNMGGMSDLGDYFDLHRDAFR